ncbi:hypothetical protein PAGA_b0502 [Pseudoalteromonas agarivorans DSM 14585]|uniref:Uncharacterized protein n=1 Tax=Pseudoalteromonas agarivorans DSM 14585 TaxID=1312369 RepID=A0ACA8E290_9GAMM|nr:hypothetical protein PAGA_b0502 [Pseudoalteromonas agarivorans DSM 14585]
MITQRQLLSALGYSPRTTINPRLDCTHFNPLKLACSKHAYINEQS